MKIYDENLEHELSAPDLDAGHLVPGKRFVEHHEAVARAYHYEIMAETVTETRPEGLRCEVEDSPARVRGMSTRTYKSTCRTVRKSLQRWLRKRLLPKKSRPQRSRNAKRQRLPLPSKPGRIPSVSGELPA